MPHAIIAAAAAANDSNPFQAFTDFLSSPAWRFIVYVALFCAAAIWLAGAFWVFADARRRIDDPIVVGVCVAAGLVFGPLAWLVYAIARPSESIEERRLRELDVLMMEQRLTQESHCAHCRAVVRDDYLVCPSCARRLRASCRSCSRPLEPTWLVCPYCEADAGPPPTASGASV